MREIEALRAELQMSKDELDRSHVDVSLHLLLNCQYLWTFVVEKKLC